MKPISKIKTMLALFIGMGLFTILSFAQLNYQLAIDTSGKTEGTDGAIETTMAQYGFTGSWANEYSELDKIKALFVDVTGHTPKR